MLKEIYWFCLSYTSHVYLSDPYLYINCVEFFCLFCLFLLCVCVRAFFFLMHSKELHRVKQHKLWRITELNCWTELGREKYPVLICWQRGSVSCAVCMLIIKHHVGPKPLQFHELFMWHDTSHLEAQAQDHLESAPVRNLILFEIE